MNSSRLLRNFIFLFSLLGLGSFAWGDRFEVLTAQSNNSSPVLELSENDEAHIISFQSFMDYSNTGSIYFENSDGNEQIIFQLRGSGSSSDILYSFGPDQTLIIPGPGKLRIQQSQSNSSFYIRALIPVYTKEISSTTAKYASVIPENAKTNVSVILEQSTDLVNWTAVSPGDFAPSTSKRFFRVRTANVPVAITGASNASPIVISSTAHGLSTGDAISVSGVAGNTAANGVFTVTKVDDNSFSLNGTTGNAAYTSGGTWLPSP
jgi:hypothetical protein